jgi:hypothetical protein
LDASVNYLTQWGGGARIMSWLLILV